MNPNHHTTPNLCRRKYQVRGFRVSGYMWTGGYLSYLWKLAVRPKCRTVSEKLPFTNSNFYKKKNMGSCADGTENFGRLVSVPKKLLLLFPEKEPFP